MTIVDAIGYRIQELCEERNLNMCSLSSLCGIPYTTVKSIIYKQSKNPGLVTIKKICDGLGITVSYFFDSELFKNLEDELL